MAVKYLSLPARIVLGIVLLCAALAFPPPLYAQNGITIAGQIRTTEGQVVTGGVMVTLATMRGGQIGSAPVDAHGGFEFDNVPNGIYELTVSGERFQTYHQTINESFGVPSYYTAYVTLRPAAKIKMPADIPALTDEAAPQTARREFSAAAVALKRKEYQKARLHLEKAVEEYPCYARAQAALAQLEMSSQKPDKAEGGLKKAIQCDGNFVDSYYILSELYIKEKRLTDSESVLKQGLRLLPRAWPLHYQMGKTHYAMEKYQEAARDFEEAESIHPDMPADFHAELANAYVQTDHYSNALAQMEIYLRMDPKGRFAPSARRASKALRSNGVIPASKSGAPAASKP